MKVEQATQAYTLGFEVLRTVTVEHSTSWYIMLCNPWKSTDILEDRIASIFRADEHCLHHSTRCVAPKY
jgi:hypothetical protein